MTCPAASLPPHTHLSIASACTSSSGTAARRRAKASAWRARRRIVAASGAPPPAAARAAAAEGRARSVKEKLRSRSSAAMAGRSRGPTMTAAVPARPARPVRPDRCTNDSTDLQWGGRQGASRRQGAGQANEARCSPGQAILDDRVDGGDVEAARSHCEARGGEAEGLAVSPIPPSPHRLLPSPHRPWRR